MGQKESEKIIQLLSVLKLEFKLIDHVPVFTSQDAATIRNAPLSSGVKAIVLKTGSNNLVLACVSGDKKIDLKKLGALLGEKRIFLASPKEVLEATGCEVGSVAPFGNLFGLKTFFDKAILENPEVEFNIGLHTKSVHMKSSGLVKAVAPIIAGFAIDKK